MTDQQYFYTIKTNHKQFFLLFCAFLLGFAFPVSITGINISFALIIIALIINHDFRQLSHVLKEPLFYLSVLMYLFLILSMLYSDNDSAGMIIRKYRKLLYILPLTLFFLQYRYLTRYFLVGFISANLLVLILSYIASFGWLTAFEIPSDNPTVFTLHITQNFFMAICALFWLLKAYQSHYRSRILYFILYLLSAYNILFMVAGRTGYLALGIVSLVWFWLILKKKQRILLLAFSTILVILLLFTSNPVSQRILQGVKEINKCYSVLSLKTATPPPCNTSMGLRTEFAYRSLKLFEQSPIIGSGAGAFSYDSDNKLYHHRNPHNEYFMQMVQGGIIALGLYLAWMINMYRVAFRLGRDERNFLIALVTAYLGCSIFNSFIFDSVEGYALVTFCSALIAEKYYPEQIAKREDAPIEEQDQTNMT